MKAEGQSDTGGNSMEGRLAWAGSFLAGLAVLGLMAMSLAPGPAWGEGNTRVVTDEMGRRVEAPMHPQRIVCLIASLTETVYALGLGDRLVGVSTYSDYPPQAKKLPRVGNYMAPNMERIVALRPDLVLATREGNPPWLVEKLEMLGIPVYITAPQDPRKVPGELARVGEVCGAPEEGKRLQELLESQYAEVARRLKGVEPRRTLLVIGSRPLVSVSHGTLNHQMIAMAGGINVAQAAPGPWPRLTREFVVLAKPQVVVLSSMERGMQLDKAVAEWKAMPGVGDRPGVRVVYVNSDLIDRPGPRMGLGLEDLARAIHPERFPPGDGVPEVKP